MIDETKEMQEQIKNALGLDPVDKEVVVLYTGEKSQVSYLLRFAVVPDARLLINASTEF